MVEDTMVEAIASRVEVIARIASRLEATAPSIKALLLGWRFLLAFGVTSTCSRITRAFMLGGQRTWPSTKLST